MTLVHMPGATTTIAIPVNNDSTHEDTENFSVVLDSATYSPPNITQGTATITIFDDDPIALDDVTYPHVTEGQLYNSPGSVLDNDTPAQGRPTLQAEAVKPDGRIAAFNINEDVSTLYGVLHMNADGTYTYNYSGPLLNADGTYDFGPSAPGLHPHDPDLHAGEQVHDGFTYRLGGGVEAHVDIVIDGVDPLPAAPAAAPALDPFSIRPAHVRRTLQDHR